MRKIISFLVALAVLAMANLAVARDSSSLGQESVLKTSVSQNAATLPLGTILIWHYAKMPADGGVWVECKGQTVDAATYPEFVNTFGTGVLPNYAGQFLRGLSTGKTVGQKVADSVASHAHSIPAHTHTVDGKVSSAASGVTTLSYTQNETVAKAISNFVTLKDKYVEGYGTWREIEKVDANAFKNAIGYYLTPTNNDSYRTSFNLVGNVNTADERYKLWYAQGVVPYLPYKTTSDGKTTYITREFNNSGNIDTIRKQLIQAGLLSGVVASLYMDSAGPDRRYWVAEKGFASGGLVFDEEVTKSIPATLSSSGTQKVTGTTSQVGATATSAYGATETAPDHTYVRYIIKIK